MLFHDYVTSERIKLQCGLLYTIVCIRVLYFCYLKEITAVKSERTIKENIPRK
jgi:hypothetical protein